MTINNPSNYASNGVTRRDPDGAVAINGCYINLFLSSTTSLWAITSSSFTTLTSFPSPSKHSLKSIGILMLFSFYL